MNNTLLFTRLNPIFLQTKFTGGLSGKLLDEVLKYNNNLLIQNRKGEYLIKLYDSYCPCNSKYISYKYIGSNGDWFNFSSRKNAQWFSKEEALEILNIYNGPLKLVKKSKNQK